MKVKEAKLSELSPGPVYRAIRTGQLKAQRLGTGDGTYRITEEALADYVRLPEAAARPAPKG
jgi:hypothetical protein